MMGKTRNRTTCAKICIAAVTVRSYGIAKSMLNLIEQLCRKSDLDIVLFTNAEILERHPELLKFPITIRIVGSRSFIVRTLFTQMILPLLIWKYDLVHAPANVGLLFSPTPQVLTIHDCYEKKSHLRFSALKRHLLSFMISHSGRASRRIIAVSRNTAKDIATYYPFLREKSVVTYQAPCLRCTPGRASRTRGLFLFVGTVEPGKNLSTLIRAFTSIPPGADYRLRIAGARWRRSLFDIPPEYEGRIEFLGPISDDRLCREYAKAWALVFPSTYEGFGLPVLEAMAFGCPVIAARNSAICEAGGNAALYFDTYDVDGLRNRMVQLAESPKLAKKLIQLGYKHVERFSWEKTARKIHTLYREVLDENRGTRTS